MKPYKMASTTGASVLAVATVFLSAPAFAQDASAAGTTQGAAASGDAAQPGLGEIIVTAQRRSESLQKAAIAVSAVDGATLSRSGVVDVAQLTKLVPSLISQPSVGPTTGFFLRGVGSLVGNAFTENPIAFNYGQVYIARPAALDGTLYDVQRVEVLKGPQGTLYGRNATGGAINVIPNPPKLDRRSADISLEVGNYRAIRTQAAVNLPVGSNVALRFAGQIARHDGYLSDGYDDADSQAVRGSALIDTGTGFRAVIMADYFHQGGKGPGSVLVPSTLTPDAYSPDDRIGGADPRSAAVLNKDIPGLYATGLLNPPQRDGFVDTRIWGVSADISYDFGPATLTLIPAYHDSRPDYLSYGGGYRGRVQEVAQQTSFEARLAANGNGPLQYVLGAFYFNEKQNALNDFDMGFLLRTYFSTNLHNRSKALFGQVTYALAPRFRVVGGVRQTWEEKRQNTLFTNVTFGAAQSAPITGDASFQKFTYKAGVEFDAGPRSLLYANVSTGFKSGGFFIAPLDNSFRPEKITAFTAGSKNRFLDNRLQLNIEGFYWRYNDQQVNYLGPIRTSPTTVGTGLVTTNAGKSRIYGAEAELEFQLTPADLFGANVQYLNGKYTDFKFIQASATGAPPRSTCALSPSNAFTLPAPGQAFLVDCSGKPQLNSPKWSLNLSYEHRFDITEAVDLRLGARSKIESSRFLSPEYLPEERQGSYTQTDLYATVEIPDQNLTVSAFVNNVENKTIYAASLLHPVTSVASNILRAPRTYCVRLAASF